MAMTREELYFKAKSTFLSGKYDFSDFCFAMIASVGDTVREYLRILYQEIRSDNSIQAELRNKMTTEIHTLTVDPMTMSEKMPDMEEVAAKMKGQIDVLFTSVKEYRNGENFRKMLNLCKHFKSLSPYNSMMVYLQCPNARFVETPRAWMSKYGRGISPTARPILIMQPFGPVCGIYDISDTYTLPDRVPRSDDDIIEQYKEPFKVSGEFDRTMLDSLVSALPFYSIAYQSNMVAGASLGAQVMRLTRHSNAIRIPISRDGRFHVRTYADFLISVNKNADDKTRFASICHELGHYFCHHLPAPDKDWWKDRGYKPACSTEEFEAETVSNLVCQWYGLESPSDRYLSGYLDSHGEIPVDISMELVCSAVKKIIDMIEQKVTYTDSPLYKHDSRIKKRMDEQFHKYQEELKRKIAYSPFRQTNIW